MGVTSKSVGNFQSIMKKLDNQLQKERQLRKEKKESKRRK